MTNSERVLEHELLQAIESFSVYLAEFFQGFMVAEKIEMGITEIDVKVLYGPNACLHFKEICRIVSFMSQQRARSESNWSGNIVVKLYERGAEASWNFGGAYAGVNHEIKLLFRVGKGQNWR